MKIIIFILILFNSISIYARNDWRYPEPRGLVEYDPINFQSTLKTKIAASRSSSDACYNRTTGNFIKKESCYICPSGFDYHPFDVVQTFESGNGWDHGCFACLEPNSNKYMEGKIYTGDSTQYSCGYKYCADGFTKEEGAGHNRECYKIIPCSEGSFWTGSSCERPPCPFGYYRDGIECVPICSDNQIYYQSVTGSYSCRYECPFPSQFNFETDSCEFDEEPEPEPEGFCFTCLIDEFTYSILDALYSLHIQVQSMFDRFLNEQQSEESEQPEEPEPEPEPELEEVLLPVQNSDFSVTQLVKNLFPTSAQCPQDSDLNILGANISFSYLRICDALSYLGTLLMILSLYASYRIIRSA